MKISLRVEKMKLFEFLSLKMFLISIKQFLFRSSESFFNSRYDKEIKKTENFLLNSYLTHRNNNISGVYLLYITGLNVLKKILSRIFSGSVFSERFYFDLFVVIKQHFCFPFRSFLFQDFSVQIKFYISSLRSVSFLLFLGFLSHPNPIRGGKLSRGIFLIGYLLQTSESSALYLCATNYCVITFSITLLIFAL